MEKDFKYEYGINIGEEQFRVSYGKHRSGWNYAVGELLPLQNDKAIYLDTFVERTFRWREGGPISHDKPWIGIIHEPANNIPPWFENTGIEYTFNTLEWNKSIGYCQGLFTLSEYMADYLRKKLPFIPISTLIHPAEFPEKVWSLDLYEANQSKKIIQIGWYLRNLHAIYELPKSNFEKVALFGRTNEEFLKDILEKEREARKKMGMFRDEMYYSASTPDFLENDEYDNLLSENIAFVNLYDASANNAVIECIARGTPLLINPLPPIIEYLGEEYPFYYSSYEEAIEKAENIDIVIKTNQYLKNLDIRKKMTGEYFRKSILQSEVYTSVQEKISKNELITRSNIPSVYIVTPSYNSSETIEETLLSVFSQKGNFNIRYHVQDGGSTDGTVEILEKWKKIVDSKCMFDHFNKGIVFTYSSEPDKGMYDAISKGFNKLEIPQDAAMTWINSDDILMPGSLVLVSDLFRFNNILWVSGYQCVRLEDGKQMVLAKRMYPTEIIKRGLCDGYYYPYLQQEGTFWKKKLWDKVNGLNLLMNYAADWDLWYRFSKYAQLYCIPVATGCFTIRENQLSQKDSGDAYEKEISKIISTDLRKKYMNEIISSKNRLTVNTIDFKSKNENYKIFYYTREFENTDVETDSTSVWNFLGKYFYIHEEHQVQDNKNQVLEISRELPYMKKNPLLWNMITESRLSYSIYRKLPNSLQNICHKIKVNGPYKVIIKKWIKENKEYRVIKKSNLFFKGYYYKNNPDVKEANINPIKHYIRYGSTEGRNPNPIFNDTWYYNEYNDVKVSGVNALAHYIKYGWKENRDPGPQFSTSAYLSVNSDVKDAKVCPLIHYLVYGILENRSIKHEGSDMFSDWYKYYPYSKKSHWEDFKKLDKELYNKEINPNHCDLKMYQDILTLWFIKKHIPEGARILEVGGGKSRILLHLHESYECWNIDKLEGIGNGPIDSSQVPYKLVRDYIGTFSNQLPDNYFDFVFSISVLEHTPDGDEDLYKNILNDINRVLKHGGISLHLFDIIVKENIWTNKLLINLLDFFKLEPWHYWEEKIKSDNELYVMEEEIYNKKWRHFTKKDYKEFGRPASFNVLWVK